MPIFNAPLSSTNRNLSATTRLVVITGAVPFVSDRCWRWVQHGGGACGAGAAPRWLGVYGWLASRFGIARQGWRGWSLLMPPILAVVYVRGSVADAIVLALLPVALAGLASW